MTIDALFPLALDDLEDRVPLGRGEYDAPMSAWLLRKLLLDSHPLMGLVNRPESRRMRIRYEFVDVKPPPGAHGWLPNGALYPATRTKLRRPFSAATDFSHARSRTLLDQLWVR